MSVSFGITDVFSGDLLLDCRYAYVQKFESLISKHLPEGFKSGGFFSPITSAYTDMHAEPDPEDFIRAGDLVAPLDQIIIAVQALEKEGLVSLTETEDRALEIFSLPRLESLRQRFLSNPETKIEVSLF